MLKLSQALASSLMTVLVFLEPSARAHQFRPPEIPVATPAAGASSKSAAKPSVSQERENSTTDSQTNAASASEFIKSLPQSEAQPSDLRSQFSKMTSTIRSEHDKASREERDAYAKEANADRDGRLKAFALEKTLFDEKNPSVQEQKEFTSRQEQARKKLFVDLEAKRNLFDKTMREKQKAYEDSTNRLKQDFETGYQTYVKEFYKRKQANDQKQKDDTSTQKAEQTKREQGLSDKQTPEERAILKEFEKQKKTPAIPLQPVDSN